MERDLEKILYKHLLGILKDNIAYCYNINSSNDNRAIVSRVECLRNIDNNNDIKNIAIERVPMLCSARKGTRHE